MSTVLVTGGAGYIGSHTLVELIGAGFSPIVLDNLSNSSLESIRRVERICSKSIPFIEGDILDETCLEKVFKENAIDSVIHFAGLKAVGESTAQPVRYYRNNVEGTLKLLQAMNTAGVKNIVFSSSATVYGTPKALPLTEESEVGGTTNPYGTSKYMVERILEDLYSADASWNIATLRYFNPVGAHASGTIGEDPSGIPNNLMPFISQVAVGKREQLSVFGGDYETTDGTGVRDYIHVVDLADGHVKALKKFDSNPGHFVVNLGTGEGYSVLEMVKSFERVNDIEIPYQVVERRAGDIAACYADTSKAKSFLGWQANLGLDDMMRDTWNWQKNNPNGYR